MSKRILGLNKDNLYRLYVTQQLSTIRIAKLLDCDDETIRQNLKRFGIGVRTRSEAGKLKDWAPEHLAKLKEGARKVNLGKIGPLHHAWKGGRHINSYGYVVLRIDKKDVLEHRHVMAGVVGRPLLPWEEVNHINGDKQNNSVENLEVIYSQHKHKDWVRRHPSIEK